MRFLADMGVSVRVVEWLRTEGHDALHLRDQGWQRLVDREVFVKALAEGRAVLTFDFDFGELAALSAGRAVSVIVFKLKNARAEHVVARLRHVLATSADAIARGAIIVVEGSRHRIRTLPIIKTRPS
ncbi:MAG TPA: DUF5615 family PIN-like protein [Phycisphaerae bacterium]|jgi:predicted nuclease of predicted toxin-antitoxin system